MSRHPLLARQLRRHLDGVDVTVEPWRSFLAAVAESYRRFDADRRMVERSMELSSEELLQANAEVRAMVQAFPDLMLHVDTAGVVVGLRGRVHRSAWLKERVLGKRLADLVPTAFGEACADALRSARVGQPAQRLEVFGEDDGQLFMEDIRLAPLGDAGVLALIADVTERSRAAEMRVAKEAAEAASRAKSAFLANMSHELRTPLNAIVGYSELLAETAKAFPGSDPLPDLARIATAGRQLLRKVNRVLDLTKIEAGKTTVDLQPVDLGALIEGVLTTVRPQAAANGNQLDATLSPDLPGLRTDAGKLEQVLINLVDNACKFTHAGLVTIDVRHVARGRQHDFVFAVADTGIGIPSKDVERLFRDFTQLDDSITRRYGGTGLGLSISRRLCELLGGRITVQSEPGRGSTFSVWLPAGLAEAGAHTDEPERESVPVRTTP